MEEGGQKAWRKAGKKYGVEKVAAEELSRRKKAETRRMVEGQWTRARKSNLERRARAAAKKRGKALGSSSIQQIHDTHPKRSSEKKPFDLRRTLSQENLNQNSNNNARWFMGEEERPAVVERPLTTSTPGPQQRTPGMNLANIMEGHKKTIHGPAKKGHPDNGGSVSGRQEEVWREVGKRGED